MAKREAKNEPETLPELPPATIPVIEAGADMPPPVAAVKNTATVFSIYPQYHLCLQYSQSSLREMANGDMVNVPVRPEINVQFKGHRAEITKDWIEVLKAKPYYGIEFILEEELQEMLRKNRNNPSARGMLSEAKARSVRSNRPEHEQFDPMVFMAEAIAAK